MKTSIYNNLVTKVEDFYPGAKATFQFGNESEVQCIVAEVVKYIGEPDENTAAVIDDIENWGYDLTAEFIEDNACYFVALSRI